MAISRAEERTLYHAAEILRRREAAGEYVVSEAESELGDANLERIEGRVRRGLNSRGKIAGQR